MYEAKNLIIFDLDGTLAESKSEMDDEMAELIKSLLEQKVVAVISGGAYKQYQKQFLRSLEAKDNLLKNLHLFPTCSTAYYFYKNGDWNEVYHDVISPKIRREIIQAIHRAFEETNYTHPGKLWGEVIEDRGTQITFSALGQRAPSDEKHKWDPDRKKREHLIPFITKYLPDGYEARIGGSTSIDITKKGVNKAYGIRKMIEYLEIPKEEMLFVGDALFKGGNDYPVKSEGVECIAVEGPEETKEVIRKIIS